MKFRVLAVDYDGTVAENDTLDPGVRGALADLRRRDIVVVLVTGRILDDLRRVAGDLHFVDAVVAENGAVIEFPDTGYAPTPSPPPPPGFVEELRRKAIAHHAGRSIVEADAGEAPRILEILRRLELPLVLAFNRRRVMVLPQAVSKATGLRKALTILRLSPHNAVGIGDAENDHELLRACEVGVAVEWGSEALKASADYVLPGEGPAAVSAYIRGLANRSRLPVPVSTRRRLLVGHQDNGQPLALAVRGRNLLIAGDPRSGKSWVTGLLCEQLILNGYSVCILDPEGDYVSLEALPGVVVFGGADPLPRPRDLLRALRHPDVSVVVDLSHAPQEEKVEYMRAVLPSLAALRRRTGMPHRIVVDEAHYFLHEPDVTDLLDLNLNSYTLVTYRASKLHPDVLAASHGIIVTCESDPHEVEALVELCRRCAGQMPVAEWERLLGGLVIGEAVALPITEEAGGETRRLRLIPRLTPHVRHLAKYVDIPVPEGRGFVFSRDGVPTGVRAQTLRAFIAILDRTSADVVDGHARRNDFSRWIAQVFGDYPLAKTVRRLEEGYTGQVSDLVIDLTQAVRARYDLVETSQA
ncbi:MAG: HAD hydrolase family protein [Gemmatimonadetes bacterium]|nr:HAD hydrolase family protein [Gemmatimonadota bacterium]